MEFIQGFLYSFVYNLGMYVACTTYFTALQKFDVERFQELLARLRKRPPAIATVPPARVCFVWIEDLIHIVPLFLIKNQIVLAATCVVSGIIFSKSHRNFTFFDGFLKVLYVPYQMIVATKYGIAPVMVSHVVFDMLMLVVIGRVQLPLRTVRHRMHTMLKSFLKLKANEKPTETNLSSSTGTA